VSPENRKANIADELAAARRARATAALNATAGDRSAAVNRLYYAAFHAARAVCLTEGLEAKTHRGLKHLLLLHFVEPGRLPEWTGEVLARLETKRDLADYAASYEIAPATYDTLADEADRLLAAIDAFLRAGGWTV
jgi:hypothetical protein